MTIAYKRFLPSFLSFFVHKSSSERDMNTNTNTTTITTTTAASSPPPPSLLPFNVAFSSHNLSFPSFSSFSSSSSSSYERQESQSQAPTLSFLEASTSSSSSLFPLQETEIKHAVPSSLLAFPFSFQQEEEEEEEEQEQEVNVHLLSSSPPPPPQSSLFLVTPLGEEEAAAAAAAAAATSSSSSSSFNPEFPSVIPLPPEDDHYERKKYVEYAIQKWMEWCGSSFYSHLKQHQKIYIVNLLLDVIALQRELSHCHEYFISIYSEYINLKNRLLTIQSVRVDLDNNIFNIRPISDNICVEGKINEVKEKLAEYQKGVDDVRKEYTKIWLEYCTLKNEEEKRRTK